MIKREEFDRTIQEAGLLITGRKITKDFADAVYDKINNHFITQDLKKTFDELTGMENAKLTYPLIRRGLAKYRAFRQEENSRLEKAKDRADTDNLPRTNPELSQMLDAILSGNVKTLEKYHLDRVYPISNAILIRKDGKREKIIIDPEQHGFMDAITIVRVQAGELTARECHIDTKKVKYTSIEERFESSEKNDKWNDDDFTEEVDDD
jgi:hypothetical protein